MSCVTGIVNAIHSGNTHGLSEQEAEELLAIPGNSVCADCRDPRPMWCSINLGITVCLRCDDLSSDEFLFDFVVRADMICVELWWFLSV